MIYLFIEPKIECVVSSNKGYLARTKQKLQITWWTLKFASMHSIKQLDYFPFQWPNHFCEMQKLEVPLKVIFIQFKKCEQVFNSNKAKQTKRLTDRDLIKLFSVVFV